MLRQHEISRSSHSTYRYRHGVCSKIVTANSWPLTTTNQAVSPDQLDHAIASAADYLDRACSPDGMFVYRVDAVSGKKKLLV